MQASAGITETRWVQPTLALYRVTALLGNGLWSGDDPTCNSRMRAILASDHLAYPEGILFLYAYMYIHIYIYIYLYMLGNGLWPRDDPTCNSRMRAILASDHLAYPEGI